MNDRHRFRCSNMPNSAWTHPIPAEWRRIPACRLLVHSAGGTRRPGRHRCTRKKGKGRIEGKEAAAVVAGQANAAWCRTPHPLPLPPWWTQRTCSYAYCSADFPKLLCWMDQSDLTDLHWGHPASPHGP
jgi:hypothetical protein